MYKKKKALKMLSLLLFIVVAIFFSYSFFFGPSTYSEFNKNIDVWDGKTISTNFTYGNGSIDNPYQITSSADFLYFQKVISEDKTYLDKNYVLTTNLDLNNFSFPNIGNKNNYFRGNFDGCGYTISNINLDTSTDIDGENYHSLFVRIENSTIKNLNISNEKIISNTEKTDHVSLLIGEAKNSTISNISINNASFDTENISAEDSFGGVIYNVLDKTSINNIVYSLKIDSNTKLNIGLFVNTISSSESSFNNIVYDVDYTGSLDTKEYFNNPTNVKISNIYKYELNPDISISNTTEEEILNLLNSNNDYKWIVENNTFILKNKSNIEEQEIKKNPTVKKVKSKITEHASGISDDTVYINELDSDYKYYMGLNYTYSENDGYLPDGTNQKIYSDSNLVKVYINYKSENINNSSEKSTVSIKEKQDNYYYYKYYPISNNSVTIDLINNPFTNLPNSRAFNGWVTDYENITTTNNLSGTKSVIIPVTYTDNKPDPIEITFYTSYVDATVSKLTQNKNWDDAFKELKSVSMQKIASKDLNGVAANTYKKVSLNNGESANGYYDSNGVYQSNTSCNSMTGCTYYEYMNYYDSSNNINNFDSNSEYYYLVTKDTNIIVLEKNIRSGWGSADDKPFTLTSVYNNTDYRDSYSANFAYSYLNCHNDTVIQNIKINSGNYNSTNYSLSSNGTKLGYLYTNNHNVILGRGIISDTSKVTFKGIIGSSPTSYGFSYNPSKYKLQVESGKYNAITLLNGTNNNSYTQYVESTGIFGSDYDKILNDNTNLIVYSNVIGNASGTISARYENTPAINMIYKSGTFGKNKYNNKSGIVVGSIGGEQNSSAKAIIEGGDIYQINGSSFVSSSRSNFNSTYLYIKGGNINIVSLGGDEDISYGNRILQITSGEITHSLIMGSVSTNTLNGNSFLYVGGNSKVGNNNKEDLNYYPSTMGAIYGLGYGISDNKITTNGNSNIIVDGNATITGNIHLGGNNTIDSKESNLSLNLKSGTINGDVYGSSETGDVLGSSTINIDNAKIDGSLFGGNDKSGTTTGDVTINFNSGEITKSLYGGGNLGYENKNNPGTYLNGNININVGLKDTSPTIKESLYGAGKYGSVHKKNATEENDNQTKIVINNALISGGVYGGSHGNEDINPNVYGNVTIDVNGGNIGTLYGGCRNNGTMYGVITANLNSGIIGDAYGGSYQSDISESNINLLGATVNNLYGGSNQNGTANITNVTVRDGNVVNVYGGNNTGGKTKQTNVTVTSKNVYGTIYNPTITGNVYAGGRLSDSDEANLTLLNTTQEISIYGGGEEANVTTTNLIATGSNVENVFGGSKTSGNVSKSNVRVENGVYSNIYGGNDMGGKTKVTNVVTVGGTTTNLYGGGNYSDTDETNVEVIDGIVANLYGGGNRSGAGTTNVKITSGSVFNAYGGSDHSGDVVNSNISTSENGKVIESGVTFDVTYEAEDVTWQSKDYPTIVHIKYKIINKSGSTIKSFNASVYAEKSTLFSNYSQSQITENDSFYSINEKNRYWGVNEIANNSTYEIEFYILTLQPKDTFKLNYGLSSSDGNNQYVSGSSIMIGNLYGGNNEGGYTENTNVVIKSGFTGDIYGGGDIAPVGTTNVTINDGKINGVYGGSNHSTTKYNTNILTTGGVVITDVYGGGNEGTVKNGTNVEIRNTQVNGNVYAGGSGSEAIVDKKSKVIINGKSIIGESVTGKVDSGCVFGGGRIASVGDVSSNDAKTEVIIQGGTIYGNVYGGANTSVVYGTTKVDVGTLSDDFLDDVIIYGTVFGGGEANASGSENYDYTYISVTKGIEINVDGDFYNKNNKKISIGGSIFGSGNASSSSGTSEITISNYGTKSDIKQLVSIQRTGKTTIDNSYIEISGTTDRTNEYSTIKYSLNRIDLLELKNNACLLLQQNANLLKAFSSVAKDNSKAVVTIDDELEKTTSNTINRLYILANKGLNVTTNQAATSYGKVSGMTFLGMYKKSSDGTNSYGVYDMNYKYGNTFASSDIMTYSSYVLGLHATNQDIKKDGFYTNDISSTSTIKQKYIKPTPDDQDYYLWNVGIDAINYTVNLTASKYSSLGTYELSMKNFATGDTKFNVLGFNAEDLNKDVSLVDSADVPKIAKTSEEANSTLGLSMKAETSEWTGYKTTKFLSKNKGQITGDKSYKTDSQAVSPSFMFYLYHAKNISLDEQLGSVIITIQAMVPTNEVEYEIKLITITVNLDAKSFDIGDCYDASISYDKKYEMPSLTSVNITNKSSFTVYYSLYATTNNYTNYYGNSNDYYHALTSSYVLPVGTTITMLDYGGNSKNATYYYYTVDDDLYQKSLEEFSKYNEVTYKLSDFIKMGSNDKNNKYSESEAHQKYYNYDYTEGKGTVLEDFLFIIDLKDSDIVGEHLNNSMLFELRNSEGRSVVSVLGMRQDDMKYNLYESSNIFLQGVSSMADNHIYKGNYNNISYKTKVLYNKTDSSENIIDTNYESVSMSVNISFLDSSGNQVSSANLQDTVLKIDGVSYFVDSDGVYRIKLSDKVSMLNKNITIKSEKALAVGTYTMKFTLFSSNDGMHNSADSKDFSNNMEVVVVGDDNLIYVESTKQSQLIEKTTATNASNERSNNYKIYYHSLLDNPNIRLSLEKRNTTSSDDRTYTSIDVSELFTYDFENYTAEYMPKDSYQKLITLNPKAESSLSLPISKNVKTGTYKLSFELYDGNHLVDSDIKYIIVKKSLESKDKNMIE